MSGFDDYGDPIDSGPAYGYDYYLDTLRAEPLPPTADRVAQLRAMPYPEYLQTPEWQHTRRKALRGSGYCCGMCGAKRVQLDVHHVSYEDLGREGGWDLLVLCRHCHAAWHGKPS